MARGLLEADPEDGLAKLQAEAVQTRLPWGAAPRWTRSRLVANLEGYSLEAGTHLDAEDREGMVHLCRYALRVAAFVRDPALAREALREASPRNHSRSRRPAPRPSRRLDLGPSYDGIDFSYPD